MPTEMKQKVALITGANKGIGLSLVKNLAKDFDGIVYLTARNQDLGLKAVKELDEQGLSVKYHQLDISDIESIKKLETYVRTTYGGLDVLINNAAILCNPESEKPLKKQIEEVVNVNYFGTLNVCNALFPLLRPNARVVNVTSDWGCIHYVKDENLRNKLILKNHSINDVNAIMNEYLEAIQKNDYSVKIYDGYKMSKNGINALTKAQQDFLDRTDRNILVSAVNPGDVKTDMNSAGNLTPDQATETILFLVKNTEEKIPRGEFWYQMKNYNWADLNLDLKAIFGAVFELENVNIR